MPNDFNLNPADVDNMTRAVRLAQERGAFKMEETAQLLPSVARLESWVTIVKQAQEQAEREAAAAATEDAAPATNPSKKKEKK